MAWQRYRLMLAVCALSALVTSGSTGTANDDGICIRMTQYVAGEGKKAVDGTTLTYCASERQCRKNATKVCCNGWKRDVDSKNLRCIKIDPADVRGVDIATDLDNGKESISVHALKNDAGLQKNVRRPRGSPSASENATAGSPRVNTDQNAGNVAGPSVQIGEQASQNLAARGDRKVVSGVAQSSQANSPAAAGLNGEQPMGPPSNDSDSTQSEPNTASNAASSRDTPHSSGEKQNPALSSGTEGGSSSQEPSKNGSPSQLGNIPSHREDPPHVIPPESKNGTSSHSATNQSAGEEQTPAEKERNGQRGDSNRTRDATGSVSSSTATTLSAATAVVPQATDPILKGRLATRDNQSIPTTLSGPIAHTEATASPVTTTPSESKGPASPVERGNNRTATNSSVVSAPIHYDQNVNLTVQSTQSNGSLPPTSKDLPHGPHEVTTSSPHSIHSTSASHTHYPTFQSRLDTGPLTLTSKDLANTYRVETIPSTGSFQSTSAPSVPTTTTTANNNNNNNNNNNINTTNASSNTTVIGVSHQQEVSGTHPAQSEARVHTGPSAVLGITNIPVTAATTTGSTPSISDGGTTAARVANTTRVPASHHLNVQPGNKMLEYNVTGNTDSGNRSTAKGASTGNSSAATGQQGSVSTANTTEVKGNGTRAANCSLSDHQKNCNGSNDTTPAVRSQSPPTSAVAKALGEQSRAASGTAEPSGGSASQTATEVTISLLLVAAVAFVAALLYWRTRRRRRRYINCGTREPNLHFSNPVYDLESMMEQTSLVKLQNAADIEDGDDNGSDHDTTSQRK